MNILLDDQFLQQVCYTGWEVRLSKPDHILDHKSNFVYVSPIIIV